MNRQLIKLMTTDGCHLCEQALGMLQYLFDTRTKYQNLFELELVEISDSDSLMEQFGVRIPVLLIGTSELAWPFEMSALESWLNQQLAN
ncbi:MAG: glutaredoxin family protein [Enterobacterales bacterium]|nr:glutaredoxin family protein [Enterobacterales bacterium]